MAKSRFKPGTTSAAPLKPLTAKQRKAAAAVQAVTIGLKPAFQPRGSRKTTGAAAANAPKRSGK